MHCRSKDKHIPEYPLKIEIRGKHNHSVKTAAALKYRDIDASVRDKFEQLFSRGYSPAAAWSLQQHDLQTEYDAQYVFVAGDRRYCPDKAWCYRLVCCYCHYNLVLLSDSIGFRLIHTHTFNNPFFRVYPGEPVPER